MTPGRMPMPPGAAAQGDGRTGAHDPEAHDGAHDEGHDAGAGEHAEPPPETLGGSGEERGEERAERRTPRFMRNYKIQEVIRRRQILLVQVVKEERGTKGAALTTYISLAGRFSVLMPNSPRGGGVSRKITSAADRRRLKEITAELDLPRGMGMIVRTAGAQRPKAEITRDGEYLLRLWDDIREHTLRSTAPALIYEEASLIKRAIRDVYSRDVDEVLVDGEDGWRAARDYMRMLMPAHARKVQLWQGHGSSAGQALFAAERVEAQLDAMLSPTVQLKSGGYLVIDQTEALVAIDVNSGRSTRERGIEETALRTNLEAADEVARQLRLRDLAGLIVIDFIDMEARRHNAAVEKRLKDALREDRARIQLGHISHFGLMEMSRQRLRPSLAETAFVACPHCGGTGHVRSTESACLHVLRAIEEVGAKRQAAEVLVHVAPGTALYILNHKRDRVADIEARYVMSISFSADAALQPAQHRIDKLRPQLAPLPAPVFAGQSAAPDDQVDETEVEEPDVEEALAAVVAPAPAPAPREEAAAEGGAEGERRRRRRRRSGRRDEAGGADAAGEAAAEATGEEGASAPVPVTAADDAAEPVADAPADVEPAAAVEAGEDGAAEASVPAAAGEGDADAAGGEDGARRRRGRRGGRRRRRDEEAVTPAEPAPSFPVYTGPTPADPFGAPVLDIFEMAELAEQRAFEAASRPAAAAATESLGVLGEAEGDATTQVPASAGTAAPVPHPASGSHDRDEAAPFAAPEEAPVSVAELTGQEDGSAALSPALEAAAPTMDAPATPVPSEPAQAAHAEVAPPEPVAVAHEEHHAASPAVDEGTRTPARLRTTSVRTRPTPGRRPSPRRRRSSRSWWGRVPPRRRSGGGGGAEPLAGG